MINIIYIIFFTIFNTFLIIYFEKIKFFHFIKDIPNFKKIHKKPIPLAGGIIIFLNLSLFYFLKYFDESLNINFVFFIGCFQFLLGLIDDKFDLSYLVKFIFLLLIFSIIFILDENFQVQNLYFETLEKNINLKKFSLPVTILCLLLFSNALNMFDGINLQAINFTLVIMLFFLLINPDNLIVIIMITLVFLFFLNMKNKLFLGNSGSYLISFIISYYLISNYNIGKISSCEEIFILLILPGIDMLRLFIERIISKNPFKGDVRHYHHILVNDIKFQKTTIITLIIILANLWLIKYSNFDKSILIIINLVIYSF